MKNINRPELNHIRNLRDAKTGDIAPITEDHIYALPEIYIEWLIDFLILTHIARRGKLLHIDTICNKLKRYASDGQVAIKIFATIISCGYSHDFNQQLKKRHFNAKFMDIDTYYDLFQMAQDYHLTDKHHKKINNFAKKFHISIVYADNVRYTPNLLARKEKPRNYKKPTKRHAFKRKQDELQQALIQSQIRQELPF